MSDTVPLSITVLFISFNGFPSTLRAMSFIKPRMVGSLPMLLF